MSGHPVNLLRVTFAVLVLVMVVAGLTTRARPHSRQQWTVVWVVFVFLMWILLGFGWLRT